MGWSSEFLYRDCGWCKTRNVAMVQNFGPLVIGTSTGTHREWSAVTCPRCGGMTIIETAYNTSPASVVRIIPEDATQSSLVDHLPAAISKHYDSARSLLDAGHPGPAVVELRKTLEGAAVEAGVTKKTKTTLQQSIQELINKGLVTKKFGEVLHNVRIVGNQGAHFSDEDVDTESAQRAMKFTTQILRNLFEVPGELDAIKAQQSQTEEEPSAATD